jgi:exonuclease III
MENKINKPLTTNIQHIKEGLSTFNRDKNKGKAIETIEKENNQNFIKICTHNVRGINKQTDQNNILQECKKQKIDILGLCETKLTNTAADFSFKNQDEYKKFHTCNDSSPYSSGISILVHKTLAKNIHQVHKIDGHLLALNFRFKGRKKLVLIQIYLPNNKQKSDTLQKQIQTIVKKEKLNNANIIIMGDFNAASNPQEDRSNKAESSKKAKTKKSWKPEIPLFFFLEDLDFLDVQKNWEEIIPISKQKSPTWQNHNSSSRIDYIWTSQELSLNNIHSFKNIDFKHISNSDHTLLQIKLLKNDLINSPKKAAINKRGSRVIVNLKEMNTKKWQEYSQKVEIEFNKLRIAERIHENDNCQEDKGVLQNIWNAIEFAIKNASKKTIPTKKIKRTSRPILKDRGHTASFKNLRKTINILSLIKKSQKESNTNYFDQINREIDSISKIYPLLTFKNFRKNIKISKIP